jgi:hypothetical protein
MTFLGSNDLQLVTKIGHFEELGIQGVLCFLLFLDMLKCIWLWLECIVLFVITRWSKRLEVCRDGFNNPQKNGELKQDTKGWKHVNTHAFYVTVPRTYMMTYEWNWARWSVFIRFRFVLSMFYYPPEIKDGNGKVTVYVNFPLKPPFIVFFPVQLLITAG